MGRLSSRFAAPAAFVTLALLMPTAGQADPYRWCAVYGGYDGGGGTNCGFVTLQQCRDTISGIGGWCEPNQFYTGPDKDQAPPAAKRKRK